MSSERKILNSYAPAARPTIFNPQSKVLHHLDTVLDFFAGSGTTGLAASQLARKFILVDNNEDAIQAMSQRFANQKNIHWIGFDKENH